MSFKVANIPLALAIEKSNKKSQHLKSMGQKGCLIRARDLFLELGSWRDESQKQFSNIVNSHNTNIIKGINDLVAEIHGLQSHLSITTNEKNDLIETVKNLSDEIRLLKSELTISQSLPEPEVNHHQEEDAGYVGDSVAQDQDEEALANGNETEKRELLSNFDKHLEDSTPDELTDDSNDTVHDEANEEDEINRAVEEQLESIRRAKERVIVDSSPNKPLQHKSKTVNLSEPANRSVDLTCSECNLVFSAKEKVMIHMKTVHSKLKLSKIGTVGNEGSKEDTDRSLKSQVYFSEDLNSSRGNELHQDSVNPDMGKNFKCELCSFITTTRRNLNAHINRVHNNCKMFTCQQCPFKTGHRNSLKIHIEGRHKKVKRHVCGECKYAATQKINLIYHMESVHNKGDKKFKCDKCPYTSASKGSLKTHTIAAHNEGEKKFKCDLCPYKSHLQSYLKAHVKSTHLLSRPQKT